MPPRSANRRASARAKKATPKTKEPDLLESSAVADYESAASELESKDLEFPPLKDTVIEPEGELAVANVKVEEETVIEPEGELAVANVKVEEVVQPMSEEKEIEQVIELIDGNSVAIEGSTSVADRTVVTGLRIEEEVPVEEANADIVMIDHVNVKLESVENGDLTTEELVQTGEKEIEQVIELIDGNSVAIEGSTSVADRTVVTGLRIEEEVPVEEANADIVMIDQVNVKLESVENGDLTTEELVQTGENADEREKEVEGEHNEGGLVCFDGSQSEIVPEINSVEEEIAAAQNNNPKAPCENNTALVVKEDGNGQGDGEKSGDDGENNEYSEEDNEGNEDDEDPSLFIHDPRTDGKKDKNLEIHIGRLDKGAVEDDLIEVFSKFGELKATRIVRNPTTKKSKGFAFIQFATVNQAKNALSELKDGVEVRGKLVTISASQDNDTLYMGNICKTWKKEDVLRTLKHYGIEHIEEIRLPDDPKNDGKTEGYALLEFSTHSDAMAAFQRLRKPDVVFGRDRSAKVAFTQTPMHPSEEVLSQVKRVYVEGLTKAWNEEKVKEICTQYGEIVKINLSPGSKHKDFGFITFTSRESALACVEGINNAHIGEGEVKVKASIAKPQYKGRLQRQGFRGGFKVTKQSQVSPLESEDERAKEAESSKMKGHAKSKRAKRERKVLSEEKGKALSEPRVVELGIPKSIQSGIVDFDVGTTSKLERTNRKRKKPSKGEGRGDGGIEHTRNKSPLKKPRGNLRGRQRNNSMKPKRDPHNRKGQNVKAGSTKYRNPYAPGYAASSAYHQGHAHTASISAPKRQYTDMEPHAGYIEPVSRKKGRPYSGYVELGVRTHDQPHAGYLEPATRRQGQLHQRYVERTVLTQSHRGYIGTAVGSQVQPYAGYLQPVVVQLGHDPYNPGLSRAGEHDGKGSNGSTYAGVGPSLAASYIPNSTSYPGYQGGGSYYQHSGAYPTPRTYY